MGGRQSIIIDYEFYFEIDLDSGPLSGRQPKEMNGKVDEACDVNR